MDYKFELSEEESQLIINILIKEPFSLVNNVINKMLLQSNEQNKNSNNKNK